MILQIVLYGNNIITWLGMAQDPIKISKAKAMFYTSKILFSIL